MTLSPTKKPGGRKSKLLDALTMARLEEALKCGNTIRTACALAGVGETTYYRWLEEAKDASEGHALWEFRESVKGARAVAIHRNVLIIQEAAKKHWQAAAWWLERSDPENWGRVRSLTSSRRRIPVVVPLNK